MPSIRVLSETIANQIAAGEVIERPANVVKELLENSLDAGAKHIYIQFFNGGLPLIHVSDNGCVMDEDDAQLCFKRHATGKLSHIDDLQMLTSFGFRGEALPSIASVAEVTLRTRRAENELGCEVKISTTASTTCTPCACPVGTDITVERLFYNVPVRRKFLKSEATESAHITHCVRLYALAYPQVYFELKQDGRLIFSSPQNAKLSERVNALWTKRDPVQWLPLQTSQDAWNLSGVISPPRFGQATAQTLYFFLNQRPITHPNLVRALREAYRGFLPDKQYPSVFLFLEMPGTDVDINVHPTKREVRFKRDAQVCAFVAEAVRECLKNACRQPFDSNDSISLQIKDIFPISGNTSFCACKNESFASEPPENVQESVENSEDMQNVSYASDAGASALNTNVLRSDETVEKGKNDINFENGTTGGFEPTKSSDNSQSTSDDKEDIAHTLQDFSDKAGCDGSYLSEAVVDTKLLNSQEDIHDIEPPQSSNAEKSSNGSENRPLGSYFSQKTDAGGYQSNTASLPAETVSESTSKDAGSTETSHDAFDIPFFALWQNRWAFFNNTSSLLVLDCKGAQLRLWYDRIASLLKQEQIGPLQTLLFPHIFSLEDRRAAFFSESLDWLKFSKICIARALNDTQFQLEALPQWVPSEQADLFIEQIAASLEYGGQMIALRYRFEPLLVRLAQRHRFEPVTNEKQVRALCRELQTCENYVTDPLGNHIWNQIYADDLMGKIRAYG
ncbi:MAG: DNA mismatch repair endonuclease MutL [Opitutales bacterium]|nr:DNA mismatch repair endonuclease MutL [Opitutales bacterium]